jgi:hypothetical protein
VSGFHFLHKMEIKVSISVLVSSSFDPECRWNTSLGISMDLCRDTWLYFSDVLPGNLTYPQQHFRQFIGIHSRDGLQKIYFYAITTEISALQLSYLRSTSLRMKYETVRSKHVYSGRCLKIIGQMLSRLYGHCTQLCSHTISRSLHFEITR